MMDVSGAKVGLGLMDRSSIECPDADLDNGAKSCEGCNTTETPLWRAGPSGPKSLCNACGIRYRKRRRDTRGSKGSRREETKMGVSLEVWEWGRDMVLKRRGAGASQEKQGSRRRMMMGEEEQAAVLLMALSSGLLYASR